MAKFAKGFDKVASGILGSKASRKAFYQGLMRQEQARIKKLNDALDAKGITGRRAAPRRVVPKDVALELGLEQRRPPRKFTASGVGGFRKGKDKLAKRKVR